jgi:very-short-patch-repair endonuclease
MFQPRARARELRKNPTDAERMLWQKLRYWQIDGCKFRRQQPLGRYIVDFACLQRKLIIELDGGQHAQQVDYDKDRDGWLRDQGFVVLRFWNNDVHANIDGVMEVILENLQSTPTSFLPHKGEGGRSENQNMQRSLTFEQSLEPYSV